MQAPPAEEWIGEIRARVERKLASHFARKRQAPIAPETSELVDAIEALTMRGGKRLRPALVYAAYRAIAPNGPIDDVVDAGAAIELFQSYLLIHDDWMDHDAERRGGPAVHVALREKHGGDGHLGASLAVLAGDSASAHAWEILTRISGSETRLREVIEVFLAMHHEVFAGQHLDLVQSEDVSRMQQLKTGSYTVKGPLLLGAVLAGAAADQRAALAAYGAPLGEAFQMRDDLLGTFGDHAALGKPIGSDLRAGKRTSLIDAAEELAAPGDLAVLREVLGDAEASDADVARARAVLEGCGARAAVEARLHTLLEQAGSALEGAPLHEPGRKMLREVAEKLTLRDR